MRDRPAAAVPDENDRLGRRVDESYHRIDVVSQADAFSVRVLGLETRKGRGVNGVAGLAKRCGDVIPARAIEPESRDQHNVYAPMLFRPPDMRESLGHTDPRLTLGIYAQATTEADRVAAERLGERFLPGQDRDRGRPRGL